MIFGINLVDVVFWSLIVLFVALALYDLLRRRKR